MPLSQILDIRKHIFTQVKVCNVSSFFDIISLASLSQQTFANLGSQIGDDRPIAQVRFSPNSQYLATGSWSGNVKLWNIPACTLFTSFRGNGS